MLCEFAACMQSSAFEWSEITDKATPPCCSTFGVKAWTGHHHALLVCACAADKANELAAHDDVCALAKMQFDIPGMHHRQQEYAWSCTCLHASDRIVFHAANA